MKKFFAACLVFIFLCTPAIAKTLNLAALFETKGINALTAQEALNGALLATQKINESKADVELKLHVVPVTSDPETTLAAIKSITQNPSITALTGLLSSTAALSAAPAIKARQLTFLCSGAQIDNMAQSLGPGTFSLAVPDSKIGALLADFTTQSMLAQNIVIIHSDLSDSTAKQAESFLHRFRLNGGKIMYEFRITEKNSDLSYITQKIAELTPPTSSTAGDDPFDAIGEGEVSMDIQKRKTTTLQQQVEAVAIFAPAQLAAQILEELKRSNITYPIIGGSDFDYIAAQKALASCQGTIHYAAQASLQRETKLTRSFVKSYSYLFGAPPESGYAALGFDSVMLLASATNKNSPKSSVLNSVLSAIQNFEGVSGRISFKNRQAVKPLYIIKMESGTKTLATELQ